MKRPTNQDYRNGQSKDSCYNKKDSKHTDFTSQSGDDNMAILPTTGHILKIGDKVKMNIKEIEKGDMDGVEFTKTGENY